MSNRTAFYGLLAILLISCGGSDIEKVKMLTENTAMPTETGKNVFISYTDSGVVRAKVYAPVLERYATEDKNETIMPKGVTVYFLGRDKHVQSYLKANYAVRYDRDRKMLAKNDVILVNTRGDTLRTEVLNWNEHTQQLYTDHHVRISTPTETIMGYGFESNTEFTKYKFKKISGNFSM